MWRNRSWTEALKSLVFGIGSYLFAHYSAEFTKISLNTIDFNSKFSLANRRDFTALYATITRNNLAIPIDGIQ
jgi:hypothetical protein